MTIPVDDQVQLNYVIYFFNTFQRKKNNQKKNTYILSLYIHFEIKRHFSGEYFLLHYYLNNILHYVVLLRLPFLCILI